MERFSCWSRMFVQEPVLCTSGTSWSLVWSSWSTTTQMTPRSVAIGTTLKSKGKERVARSVRFTPRLSLGKATVACEVHTKLTLVKYLGSSLPFLSTSVCCVFGYHSGRWEELTSCCGIKVDGRTCSVLVKILRQWEINHFYLYR